MEGAEKEDQEWKKFLHSCQTDQRHLWFDDWDDYVREQGRVNIEAMLQRPPGQLSGGGYKYGWVLLSWLEFEGRLPDAPPSRRQRQRANRQKNTQVGGGEREPESSKPSIHHAKVHPCRHLAASEPAPPG